MSGVKLVGRSPSDPEFLRAHRERRVFAFGDNVVIGARHHADRAARYRFERAHRCHVAGQQVNHRARRICGYPGAEDQGHSVGRMGIALVSARGIPMSRLRKMASFIRWRVVAVRYVTRLGGMNFSRLFTPPPYRTLASEELAANGHCAGPLCLGMSCASAADLSAQNARRKADLGRLFLRQPLQRARYRCRQSGVSLCDVAAVLTSRWTTSTDNRLSTASRCSIHGQQRVRPLESQLWHKDYGDSKSLHCVGYLNDVSECRGRSLRVRGQGGYPPHRAFDLRPPHRRFAIHEGTRSGRVREFLGKAGESIWVDPAVCYHFGSRCRNARLAVFVTFNSRFPFARPTALVRQNAPTLFEAARQVRPDLTAASLRALLRLR